MADDRLQLDSPVTLAFQTPTEESLPLSLTEVILTLQDDEILDCRLAVSVNFEQYQQIDNEELFNLSADIRSATNTKFDAQREIEIDIRLDRIGLTNLEDVTSAAEAITFLLDLSNTNPDSPFLFTENWYGLHVRQEVPLPADLATDGARLKEGYATVWAEDDPDDLPIMVEPGLDDEDFYGEQDSLWETVKDFFEASSVWSSCTQLSEQTVLRLEVQTEDALLTCYAQVVEYQDLCSFYSLCPIEIPEAQRSSVMEYITRVNYGLPIGNFELNLDVGEVRFKTSIDVEGDRLSEALLQAMTRANLEIMIGYWPGIQAIVEDGVSVTKAIEAIEDTEES